MNKLYSILLITTTTILFGCGNKTNNNSADADSAEIAEEIQTPDIEIGLDLDYSNNEYMGGNETLKYKIASNDNNFVVEPTSPYYDKYVSGRDFQIPMVVEYLDDDFIDVNMYPKFYCYIKNNTANNISINSIDFDVENSSIDKLPYFRIATEEALSNHIVFANESWFDYGGATFEYTILKKGERFNGYKNKRHIPYFKDVYQLDLKSDLIRMGYNYSQVKNISNERRDYESESSNDCCDLFFKSDELDYFAKIFYPFEVIRVPDSYEDFYMGIARIYGKLTFDNVNYIVKFHGYLTLSYPAEFGAAMEEDDSYNVELKPEGEHYTLTYPYTATLKPNESKKIGVTLLCPKSSNHKIIIRASNDAGLQIFSKKIKLHYLNPRHSSKVIWQDVKKYCE